MAAERLYSTKEVCELWSVCDDTLLKLRRRGLLRSVRVGAEVRYPESALDDYVAANTDAGSQRVARVLTLGATQRRRPA